MQSITAVNRHELLGDPALIQQNRPSIGKMFMFVYNPIGGDTLPYYDKFPVMIMVGPVSKGFYGLNLHYLEPRMRGMFLSKLISYTSSTKLDEKTELNITYQMLAGAARLKEFVPCFKRYVFTGVKSNVVMIPAPEWDTAVMLPTADFRKAKKETVWAESKSSIK